MTLDDEGAADMARLVAAARGPGSRKPRLAECWTVSAAIMADLYEARQWTNSIGSHARVADRWQCRAPQQMPDVLA